MHVTPSRLCSGKALWLAAGSLFSVLNMASAQAFTAFESPSDTLLISGRIAYAYQWNRSGTTDNRFGNGGTRLNVVYEHTFANHWGLIARWEEGLDPLYTTSQGDSHYNRQRFFGVTHPVYGNLTAGRQTSLLYDFVDVVTDQPYFYGDYSEPSWSGNDINGSVMRPSHTLKYVVAHDGWTFGAMYGWSLGDINHHLVDATTQEGLEEQAYGRQRKEMVEVGARYRPGYNLSFSGVYHYARVNSADGNYRKPNANAYDIGIRWAPGNWFLSAVGGRSRNVVSANAVNNHWGTFGQYTFPAVWGDGNDLLVYGLYDLRTDQRSEATKDRRVIGSAARLFHRTFIVALEHVWLKDKSTDGDHIYHHDSTALMARYNF